jgi:hypothetical protein
MSRQWLTALLAVALVPAGLFAADKDLIQNAKDRTKIEAQRVEKEFADGRAAAYKMVRADRPDLVGATEKLRTLLAMLENDSSLDAKRRQVLLVTVKWDLDKVKDLAGERRGPPPARSETPPPSTVKREVRRDYDDRGSVGRDAKSIIEMRSKSVVDNRLDRLKAGDRYNRVMRDVDDSAIPESRNYTLPKDWAEKSRKRSTGIKMTAKEKEIMASLNKTIEVEFSNNSLSEVIDYLKKKTGIPIILDKRGLDEASVNYDTGITLKMKATTRTVIKRMLADLGLAYIIKEEAMQVTSRERASQETTTRTYYIGDLALVVDVTLPPFLTQALMIERVNQIITMIKSNVDPKSWKDNNPEAPGSIYFDPISMSLVVKQTAEVHFMMAGK